MITSRAFARKHYAVYGLARSGLATVQALLASGAYVTGWDAKEGARSKAAEGAKIVNLDEVDLSQFDSLIVTPGLPLNSHPIVQRARAADVEIIGDVELFARARPDLPSHKVVGITGTNGKSTTTALIHHILRTARVPTTMGGNIGLPILAQDPLPKDGVYVLELSSYQIDLTKNLDCDIAVLLNITPDHLDRYESFEAYAASKLRLFKMQSPGQKAVVGMADEIECSFIPNGLSVSIGDVTQTKRRWLGKEQVGWAALQGPHNLQNAAVAAEVCGLLGLSDRQIRGALRTYPGLPHRMERIREKDGVVFVNDSKATNPAATAPALAAFDKIRWICGGLAKTDNLDECVPYFGHVQKAYTIGEAGELFARLLSPNVAVAECKTLERAVGEAAADARSGDTVLLSPACASFDQFRDFEQRGDMYRELVGAL